MPREAQKSDPVLEFFPPEEAERAESAPRPTPILSDVVQKRHAVHPPPPIDDSVARIPALSVLDDAEGNEEKPWTLPVAEESDSEAPTVPPPHPEEYKETVRRLSMQAPDEKAGDETKEAPPPVSDVRTNLRRGAALALQSDGPQSQPDPELQKILEKRIEEAIWGFYSIGIDVEPLVAEVRENASKMFLTPLRILEMRLVLLHKLTEILFNSAVKQEDLPADSPYVLLSIYLEGQTCPLMNQDDSEAFHHAMHVLKLLKKLTDIRDGEGIDPTSQTSRYQMAVLGAEAILRNIQNPKT